MFGQRYGRRIRGFEAFRFLGDEAVFDIRRAEEIIQPMGISESGRRCAREGERLSSCGWWGVLDGRSGIYLKNVASAAKAPFATREPAAPSKMLRIEIRAALIVD